MGCQGSVVLGKNLTFSICCHDPDTGVLTDADAVPAYRLYEDENATPILSGNMAKLDDANTTGFYTELIACTIANGFEDGKTYTVYIEATVDGDTGGIAYSFNVQNGNRLGIEAAYMHNPTVDQPDIIVAQVGIFKTQSTAAAVQVAEITTPGLIKIWRYRKGIDVGWTLIVAGGGMAAMIGGIYYTYTFPSADWEEGDLILYDIYDTILTLDGEEFYISTVQGFGVVGQSTILAAIKAKTDTLGGAGAIEWTYTLTDHATGGPIDGAEIWVTSDSAGLYVLASGTTDSAGQITFMLDAGTVYVWAKKAGYNIDDLPDEEVVA